MSDYPPYTLLGQLLLVNELITPDELSEALRRQQTSRRLLGDILLDMGAIAPQQLEQALRSQIRLRGREDSYRDYILVVDDDHEVGAVVADILEGAGYRVGVAQNFAEAIVAARAGDPCRPAAIILDLVLPDGSGIELLSTLRKSEYTRTLPVVVLTGRPDLESEIQAQDLEISNFLAKPISARELLERVDKVVSNDYSLPTDLKTARTG